MPDPTEFVHDTTGAVLEKTEAYFKDLNQALSVGVTVLDSAVSLHQLGADLEGTGEDKERDNSALYPAAAQLAEIVRKSYGMLQGMASAGYVEMSDDNAFELVAPTALALEAGEFDGEDSVLSANSEEEANSDPADGEGDSQPEVLLTEVRQRQEKVLTDVFGKELQDEISSLKEEEMPFFGQAVKALYMGAKVTGRGAAVKEDRAEQFEAVLAGFDDQELTNEYGETATKILANLERAATVTMPKSYEPKYLQVLFGQVRKQYQELNAATATA